SSGKRQLRRLQKSQPPMRNIDLIRPR
ncbi:hypothetical protein D018_3444B, partial [Vibrio parahaemolyticus VP2007-007]